MAEGERTRTYRSFVNEPIGEKLVSELPGIGDAHRRKLNGPGINIERAYELLGVFLSKKKNKEAFKQWLQDKLDYSTENQRKDCADALEEYFSKYNS